MDRRNDTPEELATSGGSVDPEGGIVKPWAEMIAAEFHRQYEDQAPHFGYETRPDSAVDWADVPEKNKRLMIRVVANLLAYGVITPGPQLGRS